MKTLRFVITGISTTQSSHVQICSSCVWQNSKCRGQTDFDPANLVRAIMRRWIQFVVGHLFVLFGNLTDECTRLWQAGRWAGGGWRGRRTTKRFEEGEDSWKHMTSEHNKAVQLQLVQANVQLKHDVSFSEHRRNVLQVIVFLWLLQYTVLDILTILALSAECKQV